jgi:hypothetical protein
LTAVVSRRIDRRPVPCAAFGTFAVVLAALVDTDEPVLDVIRRLAPGAVAPVLTTLRALELVSDWERTTRARSLRRRPRTILEMLEEFFPEAVDVVRGDGSIEEINDTLEEITGTNGQKLRTFTEGALRDAGYQPGARPRPTPRPRRPRPRRGTVERESLLVSVEHEIRNLLDLQASQRDVDAALRLSDRLAELRAQAERYAGGSSRPR